MSNIFQGGGGGGGVGGVAISYSIDTYRICDFSGGTVPPVAPSGSAHDFYAQKVCLAGPKLYSKTPFI